MKRTGSFCLAMMLAWPAVAADRLPVELVKPSTADPRIVQYDDANVVIVDAASGDGVPLVVYLPGTNGRPQNVVDLLQVVAGQGYRVIGLAYDDQPSVSKVCPDDPDPACSAAFRQVRSFGNGAAKIANPPEEAIVSRLVTLLAYLDRRHPGAGWDGYLDSAGRPAWDRIVLSGLSQGAGMAAYIAKQVPVRRVVLFSSPWDTAGADRHPAPWLSTPSATPADRWWAERHVDEATTGWIAHAYAALGIPADHLLLFDRPLASTAKATSNPFHGSTVRDIGYLRQWQVLFGSADR